MEDPVRTVYRLQVPHKRREHVARVNVHNDLKFDTEGQGYGVTLVATKTRKSWDQQVHKRKADESMLKDLLELFGDSENESAGEPSQAKRARVEKELKA